MRIFMRKSPLHCQPDTSVTFLVCRKMHSALANCTLGFSRAPFGASEESTVAKLREAPSKLATPSPERLARQLPPPFSARYCALSPPGGGREPTSAAPSLAVGAAASEAGPRPQHAGDWRALRARAEFVREKRRSA